MAKYISVHQATISMMNIQRVTGTFAGATGFSLLLITMFAPTTLMLPKYVLISAFLLTLSGYLLTHPVFKIESVPFVIMTAIVLVGMGWTVYAIYRDNPGARSTVTVHLLYPLCFTILSAVAIRSYRIVYLLQWLFITATVLISLYVYSYIGFEAGILPSLFYIPIELQQNIGFYDGFVEYTIDNLATFLFLVPYLLAAAFIWPRNSNQLPSKWIVWGLLISTLPLVILSGRRGLQLVVILSIPLTLGTWLVLPRSDKIAEWDRIRKTLIVGIFGSIISVYLLSRTTVNPAVVLHRFFRAFNPSASLSTSLRAQQFTAMMNGLVRKPLFGYGFGAVVDGIIRAPRSPWAYELLFVKMLYDVGMVGFSIYLGAFIWLCRRLVSLVNTGSVLGYHVAPIFVGMTSFFIASATNPYLNKFGYMWVIFIPLGIVHFASAYKPGAASAPLLEKNEA